MFFCCCLVGFAFNPSPVCATIILLVKGEQRKFKSGVVAVQINAGKNIKFE